MGQQAELVIFSSDPGYIAEPIVRALDPYQMAMYNLYREHCHQGATPVKDLSRLNRRESAILTVDVDPKKHALQPQNGIVVPKWNGDPNDRYLYTLMDTLTEMLIFAQSQRGTPRGSLPELLTEMRGGRRDDSTPDVVATWTAFKQKARAEYAAVEAQRASERQQKGGLAAWLTGASIMSAQNAHAPPSNPIDRAEFLAREDRAVWARDREKNLAAIRLQHKQQEQQIIAMTENMKAEKKRLFDYMFAPPMAPAAAGAAPPAAPPSA
ncbi:hypothetical protein CXG81DRAFT_9154 [Caulochytrium protostelioides]|uniref:Mitochondrial import inner membrane translocase subunit TIM50 n=1 Tax=Caulochytrium protostelioides TaxID=1555241 RepID=A0A4P9XDZ4_9FUNG|nr:hypothetical protein CXG81DRAFT_9154 [Caulochytrium protostelioides]|eukprot:RKP03712.1 hypothetical protein CXG81DRAFT_9154 [Caulochytrium protostelioides]